MPPETARQPVRLGEMRPDPASAGRRRLERDVAQAETAFRRTVIEDWPNAMHAYFAWTDAMFSAGGYADIPHFAEAVDLIAYRAAGARRGAAKP